ncbi:hypothetical protein AC1031_002754 [Aphanomyces cochlioides]|nr:hypothetical protein AC1031_002731 [Aphanomyces cochlioides]KAG9406433.1 hypothetical protein AC1031_002754 [Aphanomyces cochlioides]
MEGDGAYNKAAICQMDLVEDNRPSPSRHDSANYCIVDLGASQGRNSLQLIRHVLKHLEPSFPNDKRHEFLVLHEDQPSDDFGTLLNTLNSSGSYVQAHPNVYTGAISKSFYERVMPAASVDIFVSYISTHWLSKIPAPLPGPSVFCDDPECQVNVSRNVLDAWRQVAHEDLVGFLRHRATELVDHGALCRTYASNNGNLDMLEYFNVVNGGLRDMVAMGALSSESLHRIAVPSVLRTTEEFMEAAAEVPELELHEYQHVTLDFNFDNASGAVNFVASVLIPSLKTGMTEEERKDPKVRDAFKTCMAARFSEPLAGNTKPFYEQFTIAYFYSHFTRHQRST